MKKLESLKNEKFAISKNDLGKIKGGLNEAMDESSISSTYTEYDTLQPNGGFVCDTKHTDSCIDF